MNYIILNNKKFFEDKIVIRNFKEVKNETDRCDAVFGEITKPILEEFYQNPERRDSILPNSWLLRDRGTIFILCKIDTSILHDENGSAIERLLAFYDQESFYIEIRSYNSPQSYNQLESYVFAYNKNLGYQNNILPDKIDTEDSSILEVLCKSIEKQLL